MQLELISPDNDSVVLSHTVSLGLLGSLKAAGVDLSALLPKEAIAATWDTSVVPLLEGYLDHLRANTQGTYSHVEHVVVREVDMTPEQKNLLPLHAYTSKSINDYIVYEYDRVIADAMPPVDTHVEEEKDELLKLLAFFTHGETEHDLLHNDLYTIPEKPVEDAAAQAEARGPAMVAPAGEETGANAEVTPLS